MNKSITNTRFSFAKFLTFWLSSGDRLQISHDEFETFSMENMCKDENGRWTCKLCGKSTVNKIDVTRHIESTHVELPMLMCDLCHKYFKTKKSLRTHQIKFH